MPTELKTLLRHASIDTTMKYYVDIQADDVAAGLWARFGNTKTAPGESGTVSGTF
jgi:integrase